MSYQLKKISSPKSLSNALQLTWLNLGHDHLNDYLAKPMVVFCLENSSKDKVGKSSFFHVGGKSILLHTSFLSCIFQALLNSFKWHQYLNQCQPHTFWVLMWTDLRNRRTMASSYTLFRLHTVPFLLLSNAVMRDIASLWIVYLATNWLLNLLAQAPWPLPAVDTLCCCHLQWSHTRSGKIWTDLAQLDAAFRLSAVKVASNSRS